MNEAYITLRDYLKEKVTWLNWIDLDKGQLKNPQFFHSPITPALLVGMGRIEWQTLGGGQQIGYGTVTLTLLLSGGMETYSAGLYGAPPLAEPIVYADNLDDLFRLHPDVLGRTSSELAAVLTFQVITQTYQVRYRKAPGLKTVALPDLPDLSHTLSIPQL